MAFDPDKYLQEKSASAGEFNPDAYLQSKIPVEGPSTAKALLEGAKQGGTLGFSDELGGGTQAILDLLGKAGIGTSVSDVNAKLAEQGFKGAGGAPLENQSTADVYRQARNENRAEDLAAQQAHPLAHLLGNIGGGVVTGGALGKAGLGLGEAATSLGKVGEAAKLGAKVGGVAGLGSSQADLTEGDVGKALEDVATGVGTGAIGGAAIQGAGEGLGALKDLVAKNAKKFHLGKQISRAYELGTEGQGIASEANKLKFTGRVNKEAQKLSDFITNQAENSWKSKLEALKSSGKQFDLQDIEDLANQEIDNAVASAQLLPDQEQTVRQTIQNALYKKIPDEAKKAVNSVIKTTKQVTRQVKGEPQTIQQTTFKGKEMTPEELKSVSENLQPEDLQSLSTSLTKSPSKETISQTQGLMPPKGSPAAPQELGPVAAEEAAQRVRNIGNVGFDMTRPQVAPVLQRIAGKASGALKQAYPETEPFTDKISTLKQLSEQLGGAPEKIKALGTSPAKADVIDFVKKMTDVNDNKVLQNRQIIKGLLDKVDPEYSKRFIDKAERTALDQSISGEAGKTGLAYAGQTIKSIPLTTANLAGFGSRQVSKVVNSASKLASWPQQRLQSLSNALKTETSPAAQRLGSMLDGTMSGDANKRSALLFSISQNKDYRDIIDKMTPNLFSKEEANE